MTYPTQCYKSETGYCFAPPAHGLQRPIRIGFYQPSHTLLVPPTLGAVLEGEGALVSPHIDSTLTPAPGIEKLFTAG